MNDWFDQVLRWWLLSLSIPIFFVLASTIPLLIWASINENPWLLFGLWFVVPVTAMFGIAIKSLWED